MDLELPINWKLEKLGNVCETTSGGTPSRKNSEYYGGTIPWIKSGELDKGLITDSEEKITAEAVKNSSAKVFPKGTLLIALYGATIGKLAFLGIEAATNQAICGIFKNDKIDQRYLYNYLFFKRRDLINRGIGGAQPNISQTILKNLDLPVPPLTEQYQIVEKIEELFSELDKGIEYLKTAQQQLKVYRQAVLKWAFEGKLTNGNVKDGELPEGWEWVTIEQVSAKITDGEHFRPITQESGIPFLSAKDVQDYGVSFANPLYIAEETAKNALKRCNPQRGDILIVSRGATVGRMCIVETDKIFCLLGSVILIKINKRILSKYLNYVLKSSSVNQEMISVSGATAQQAIYLRDIKNVKFPICSLQEQTLIIQEIESRLSVCDKMEETITASLQQAEALRQSILKTAFEGKLVKKEETTNPAVIAGHEM